MTILLAILTVACVSWIITRESLFEPLRKWARGKKYLYPLSCVYCLCPWLMLVVFLLEGLPWRWYFPAIWLAYVNVAVFSKVRG